MSSSDRAKASYEYRKKIARNNMQRCPTHMRNMDEDIYPQGAMNFTKGLEHDVNTGLVSHEHFQEFRAAIDSSCVERFNSLTVSKDINRKWEAPTAGVVFDPQGPDAQAVTMYPAPALNSKDGSFDELAFEMAEVYELAFLRDIPFAEFEAGPKGGDLKTAIGRLNCLKFAKEEFQGNAYARPRKTKGKKISRQTAFRGSSYGVEVGPYLSCFLLMGDGQSDEGEISYGNQVINQRVRTANNPEDSGQKGNKNYLTKWSEFIDAQNGKDLFGDGKEYFDGGRRFIHTPRDLASYVHDDALYQAYLNACLILLKMKAPLDPHFNLLSGEGAYKSGNVTGFALFGGPHILSLVTEVATRALKAVRWQKFNNHLRLRPEALAARIARADKLDGGRFQELREAVENRAALAEKADSDGEAPLKSIFEEIEARYGPGAEALLPMAYPEGSPMHPSYGAGHATVAGACTTVLKAFFDTDTVLRKDGGNIVFGEDNQKSGDEGKDGDSGDVNGYCKVITNDDGSALKIDSIDEPLTLLGELNKLAANISIGRNMAGVHYFSDYYDSVRMGERIARGILQDQADGYPKDAFTLSYVPFDATSANDKVMITRS